MSRLLRSSGAAGAATLISRVLGFVREAVMAAFMGDKAVASAFYLAMTIPNLFRRLLGEGALTAAFIPIFKDKEANEGEEATWKAANAVICALVMVCTLLVTLAMAGLALAILFLPLEARNELVAGLLFVMFPYVGLVCVAAVFIGMLNARGHFFVPALGAATLNLVLIASVYLIAPHFGATKEKQVFGLAVGLAIAGAVQAAFQWPALRKEGFRFNWVNPLRDPTVREVARKMAPAALGVAAYQLNVVITQSIAYAQEESVVASFNYAVRLMELPQGVVGISLATYLLTELSALAAEKKMPEFREVFREGLKQVVFMNGLATVLLFVLAEPIIRLLFQRGEFTAESTERAAFALVCLAPGLVAFSINNLIARAFYALGDTKTPMRIAVFCLGLNLLLSLFLIPWFLQGGMGLANSASAIVNCALLAYALKRKLPKLQVRDLGPNFAAIAGAGVLAGLTAWGVAWFCIQKLGVVTLLAKLVTVFGAIGASGLVYVGLALWLKLPQAHDFLVLIRSRLGRKPSHTEAKEPGPDDPEPPGPGV
jgi:putative peptidoglycan lipid II flippase